MVTNHSPYLRVFTYVLLGLLMSSYILPITSNVFGMHRRPRTKNLRIHFYPNKEACFRALDAGEIDICDWPVSYKWIDKWATDPKVSMLRHTDMGMIEFDINHQLWPTGCEEHMFFNETCRWCQKAREFRRSIAHLVDKTKYIQEILGGFGLPLDLPISPLFPHYERFVPDLETAKLTYPYNSTRAIELLDKSGFIDTDGDTIRNDPRKWYGPDGIPYSTDDDLSSDSNIEPLIFWVRETQQRESAASLLTQELRRIGIQVETRFGDAGQFYSEVHTQHNFHVATGGWSFRGLIVESIYYELYSSFYYPRKEDAFGTKNYVGYCNHEFDAFATELRFAKSLEEAEKAAKEAGLIFARDVVCIPLWVEKSMHCYRTGWEGVANFDGYGISNGQTFCDMYREDDDTIDWGFSEDILNYNPLFSEWWWESSFLGLIYSSLMRINPSTLMLTEHYLATDHEVGTWESPYGPATEINFTLREGITWHDGSPFGVEDVVFTLKFIKACETHIPFMRSVVSDIVGIDVLEHNKLRIRIFYECIWALQWLGSSVVLKKSIWGNIKDDNGRTWEDSNFDFSVVVSYNPLRDDADGNGEIDLKQDGTGEWVLESYKPGEFLSLKAHPANTEAPSIWFVGLAISLLIVATVLLLFRRAKVRIKKKSPKHLQKEVKRTRTLQYLSSGRERDHEKNILKLTKKIDKMQKRTTQLEAKVIKLQTENQELKNSVYSLKTQNEALRQAINLENKRKSKQRPMNSRKE